VMNSRRRASISVSASNGATSVLFFGSERSVPVKGQVSIVS
jgi:hypothetical protein